MMQSTSKFFSSGSTRKLATALVLLTGISAGSAAFAGHRDAGHKDVAKMEERHQKRFEKMADKLDLSDEQRQQAEAVRADHKAAMKSLKEQMKQWREDVPKDKSQLSDAEIDALAYRRGELATAMSREQLKHKRDFDLILNDEQKAQMAEWKERREERGARHGGKHHRMPMH